MKTLIRAVIYLLQIRLDDLRSPVTHDSYQMAEADSVKEMIRQLEEEL